MHSRYSQYKQTTLLVQNNAAQHVKVTCLPQKLQEEYLDPLQSTAKLALTLLEP